ncbi:DNA-binding protein [Oceaniferula spumae]|uniref:DNA-binding protein n=1 Tax=Oceaniferula spumae TaxID=2979115 RepID=A0AAT9FGC5_9BACT
MSESSYVLVDTNVILDVTEQDKTWSEWSENQLSQYVNRLLINPLIYTELCYEAGGTADVDAVMIALGLHLEELPREALFLTSQAYKQYRQRGGTKTAPLADFFIGAHATALEIPILTRDVTRYNTYFHDVRLITP